MVLSASSCYPCIVSGAVVGGICFSVLCIFDCVVISLAQNPAVTTDYLPTFSWFSRSHCDPTDGQISIPRVPNKKIWKHVPPQIPLGLLWVKTSGHSALSKILVPNLLCRAM